MLSALFQHVYHYQLGYVGLVATFSQFGIDILLTYYRSRRSFLRVKHVAEL